MQEKLSTLRSLQELDQDIYKLRQELKRLPAERAQRRADLDQHIARRDELAERARQLRVHVKEIEDETSKQRQRMRKVETEAMNARTDVATQAAFQHEAKTLRRAIGGAEEEGLKYVTQAGEIDNEVARLTAEIEQAEAVQAEFEKNVESEMAEASRKLAELEAQRKGRVGAELDPESMSLYERLLEAREGVALAELDGRVCQACYMEVPTNLYVRIARGTTLAQCPSCDRILYLRS